ALPEVLPSFARATLTDEGVRHAANGRDLERGDFQVLPIEPGTDRTAERGVFSILDEGSRNHLRWHPPSDGRSYGGNLLVRLFNTAGDLVGIAQAENASGVLHPSVILM